MRFDRLPGVGALPALMLVLVLLPLPASTDLTMDDLVAAPAAREPSTLAELLAQVDEQAAELEADRDVKCWTSLGQLESFVAGAELSPQATHMKSEVVLNYLDQLWAAAAARASGKPSIDADIFDAAVAYSFPFETIELERYRVHLDPQAIEIPYQDVRDYEVTVEPLRLMRTLVQRVMESDPQRPPLTLAALASARHLSAILSTAVLKEANVEARRNRHTLIEVADVTSADTRMARSMSLAPHDPASSIAKRAPLSGAEVASARQAMLDTIQAKIDALDSFNTRYSKEKLGETFDPGLEKDEAEWADLPVDRKASDFYRKELLVELAKEVYRECAEQHPVSDPLTGPEMLDTLARRYPKVTEHHGTTNLFPTATDTANVWVPEYMGDTFRDSGWHWKAFQIAVQSSLEANPKLPSMDLYAMEELSELLSIYAIALLRRAGHEAKTAGAEQVTPEMLAATHQVFEHNRKEQQASAARNAAADAGTRAAWEAGSARAKAGLEQSYVAELFTDVTGRAGIRFVYKEDPAVAKARFSTTTRATDRDAVLDGSLGPEPGGSGVPPSMELGISGGGVAVADVDGDGLLDVYLVSGRQDRLYRNLGDLRFEDVTDASGLRRVVPGRGAYFVDYDNDGDKDLFVTRVRTSSNLYRNRGNGTFEDVTRAAGLPVGKKTISHSATWFDYDNDGNLDVYIGNFGDWPDRVFPHLHQARNAVANQLFRNTGDGTFEDVSEATRANSTGWTHAVSHFDANNDGWQDLYLANDFGADELLINIQGERFLDFTPIEERERSLHGMSVGFTDANKDGIEDVYVSNIAMFSFVTKYIKPGRETEILLSSRTVTNARMIENNAFLVSGDGTFTQRQHEFFDRSEEGDGWAWDADFFDFDNDGQEDLYVANGREPGLTYDFERNVLYRQSDGRFYDVSRGSGADIQSNSRGAVAADFDADGDLDIVINNFIAPATLLRNNLRRNNWVQIDLEGTRSNRDGIGARVYLHTDDGVQLRTMRGGSGFLSHEPTILSFGLGSHQKIEKLEIHWPSGTRQVVPSPAINRLHRISESPPTPVASTDRGAEGGKTTTQ